MTLRGPKYGRTCRCLIGYTLNPSWRNVNSGKLNFSILATKISKARLLHAMQREKLRWQNPDIGLRVLRAAAAPIHFCGWLDHTVGRSTLAAASEVGHSKISAVSEFYSANDLCNLVVGVFRPENPLCAPSTALPELFEEHNDRSIGDGRGSDRLSQAASR